MFIITISDEQQKKMQLLTVQSSPASIYFLLSFPLEDHHCYLFPNIMRYQVSHTQPQENYSFLYFHLYMADEKKQDSKLNGSIHSLNLICS